MNTIFNKNSLFWKIFLAFWLANFLVIIATSYLTLVARDNDELQKRKQKTSKIIGQIVINSWEIDNTLKMPLRFKHEDIKIEGPEGNFLFKSPLTKDKKNYFVFDHLSESNKNYKIYLPIKKTKNNIGRHLQKKLSVRLLPIFIISGLVSYILSKMITTPLKRLGKQTQLIAKNNLDQAIESNLLTRKDEIGELARDFEEALNHISILINSKQTLLHDVSHELRAPLARLMAAIGLLEQDSLKESNKKNSAMLNRIELECDNMNELIDQILKLSRVEGAEPKKNNIDVIPLIKNSIADTQFEYQNHAILFDHSDEAITIFTDSNMLLTVLNNILRNGCQHTPKGTQIKVSVKQQNNFIEIIIKDNGNGLSSSEVNDIFKPFLRINKSNNNFGLGLNITQRIIEKLQGSIKAYSKENDGLTFVITLPTS